MNTWKNMKESYKNNKFIIPAPTWNEGFEWPDGSYSISDIQDYFECILNKHGEKTVNPSIRIYVNKIESSIVKEANKTIFNLFYLRKILHHKKCKTSKK